MVKYGSTEWIIGRKRSTAPSRRVKGVRVTGMVIRREDIPTFVQKAGEPEKSGVPVQSEADLPKAKRRYLLANVTWKLID